MIEINNLTKTYSNQVTVDNISLNIKRGEIIGFLGPNGAGKTTTLRLITSFLSPCSGSITIGNLNVAENSIKTRKRIGYLPEMVPLYDELLVYEYLNFVAEIREIPKSEINRRVKEVINECGLEDAITRPIDELSKGFRQRVGLAQAIIHKPDILILDEPTTGLDPNQIIEIRKLIKEIGKEKTIIFSTHILSEASAISDKIAILNKGKIVATGTSEELQNNLKKNTLYKITIKGERDQVFNQLKNIPQIESVKIHNKEANNIYEYHLEANTKQDIRENISKIVAQGGFTILEFTKSAVSLEDVFRELTINK